MCILEHNIALPGLFDDLLQKAWEKGQRAAQHEVKNNAETENINALIKVFTVNDLRSDEPRSACILFLSVHAFQRVFVDGKPKVDDFDFLDDGFGFLFAHNYHDIFGLEVSVDEPNFFKVLNNIDQLFHNQCSFILF